MQPYDNILPIVLIFLGAVFVSVALWWLSRRCRFRFPKTIHVPARCTLDHEGIDSLVKTLRAIRRRKRATLVDFTGVSGISYEAFMVFLAQAEKVHGRVLFNFGTPAQRSSSVSYIVRKIYGPGISSDTIHPGAIDITDHAAERYKRSMKVNPDYITSALEPHMKRTGMPDYYDFNTLVTEMVANAIEHGIINRQINWWMYIKPREDMQQVRVVILDMGIGIVRSYRRAGLPRAYRHLSDSGIVTNALLGNLGSSTGEEGRGRGLPQIHHMLNKNWISSLVIITNTVTLRFNNGEYRPDVPHKNFSGTYYEFTVTQNNYNTWKES